MEPDMLPEVNAAVAWWADCLRRRAAHDNGVPLHGMMAMLAARVTALPPEAKIQKFCARLTEGLLQLTSHMRGSKWPDYGPCVCTDYDPDGTLQDALNFSSIEDGNLLLPMKTVMRLDRGNVTVSCGYGRAPQAIFTAPPPASP